MIATLPGPITTCGLVFRQRRHELVTVAEDGDPPRHAHFGNGELVRHEVGRISLGLKVSF